jgi:CubicO group peptidase (beta-lactamase class C family)
MTKAITSVAAMQLVEQGVLSLDAPLGPLLPEIAAPDVLEGFDTAGQPILRPARTPITLRHLLTHTAGYGYDTWNDEILRFTQATGVPRMPTNAEELRRSPLLFEPGTRWNYGISTDVLGRVVEVASGRRLADYFAKYITGPLGMADTGFWLTPAHRARAAATHARQPDGSLRVVASDRGYGQGYLGGGGALCSTAADYLRFLRMILSGGTLEGVRILAPETLAEMGRNQIGGLEVTTLRSFIPERSVDTNFFPEQVQKWGLGFLINTERTQAGRSPGSLAWAGAVNTFYWIDPTRGVAGVMMAQVTPFADARVVETLWRFERAVYG